MATGDARLTAVVERGPEYAGGCVGCGGRGGLGGRGGRGGRETERVGQDCVEVTA